MIFDPLYLLVIGAGMALSLGAQWLVKSRFKKYSQLGTRSQMTGADVARSILRDNDIHDVSVEPVAGSLSDHYDPRSKTLRLSEPVFGGRSMAAFGVAAHEVGHAIQHARGYAPLRFRSAWVPIAGTGGNISIFVIIAAVMMGGMQTALGGTLGLIGLALFATTTLFTLVTLPVEFDASKRALACLQGRYVTDEEFTGAKKVLNAAAMTYVAAFATSLMTLLYWAMRLGLLGGRRD
ncbi:MAG: zinc metallopeptidase [Myxococcales bacterium]|nr:zinc metallopeptidase [Myxococcales bacterium]